MESPAALRQGNEQRQLECFRLKGSRFRQDREIGCNTEHAGERARITTIEMLLTSKRSDGAFVWPARPRRPAPGAALWPAAWTSGSNCPAVAGPVVQRRPPGCEHGLWHGGALDHFSVPHQLSDRPSTPIAGRFDRARSPQFPATIHTIRIPYAGESLTAPPPRHSPLPWPHREPPGSATPRC
jgi:hypothetical protein